jgi:hypothetical protein
LLFLVYPLGVVDQAMADRIVGDVVRHLQGDVGIRRYIGDSYWCADWEAQWCIFDPITSAIYGDRFLRLGIASDIENQSAYFNRSLGQITSTLQCPEAYFIERCKYVPNDNVPLRWTQANLWLALKLMKSTAA